MPSPAKILRKFLAYPPLIKQLIVIIIFDHISVFIILANFSHVYEFKIIQDTLPCSQNHGYCKFVLLSFCSYQVSLSRIPSTTDSTAETLVQLYCYDTDELAFLRRAKKYPNRFICTYMYLLLTYFVIRRIYVL